MKSLSMKRLILALCAATALSSSLTGCLPLVMGGAAAGTALVATDRRTSGAQLDDEGIELRAASRIRENFGTRVRASVTSYNRVVLLTGEVPNARDKEGVQQVVAGIDNVGSVVNELSVLNSPSLMERSSDTLITGRVKAAILDASDLQSNAFKVVTERGTVFLMGRVTPREADKATALARAISGVQKVVRVFESITEDELNRMKPQG